MPGSDAATMQLYLPMLLTVLHISCQAMKDISVAPASLHLAPFNPQMSV